MTEFEELLADPRWFVDAFYVDRKKMDICSVDRKLLSDSPFLDSRMTVNSPEKRQISYTDEDLDRASTSGEIDEVGMIFHTSFCRSTLMAKALHVDGVSFSLKEPSVLLSIAESIRYSTGLDSAETVSRILRSTINLCSRLIGDDETVIIKPTNFANNILPAVLDAGCKVLLMYGDLRAYLVSILKYGEPGRDFTRNHFVRLMEDEPSLKAMPLRDVLLLTDLKIATMVWITQIQQFNAAIQNATEGTVKSLSSDVFAERTGEVLQASFEFFGIDVTAGKVSEIVEGPVFTRHSKNQAGVDNQQISDERRNIESKFEQEIEATLKWADGLLQKKGITLPLDNALIE